MAPLLRFCLRRVAFLTFSFSKRVEKQIADIQGESEKKRMAVSDVGWIEMFFH